MEYLIYLQFNQITNYFIKKNHLHTLFQSFFNFNLYHYNCCKILYHFINYYIALKYNHSCFINQNFET